MSKIQSRDYRKLISLALIPIFLIVIEILVVLDIQTVFEPPYLLLITNTVFVGIIPLYIAYLSFRTYTAHGRPGVLLLGGGMLVMGMGSILAAIVRSLPDGANLNVTIYNTAFFVGAVFAYSAALANIYHPTWISDAIRTRTAALAYTGVVLFTFLFTGATIMGLVPRFFIQDVGPTLLRQGILISAIVLLAVSSVMFYLEHMRKREDFFFWMAISLGLVAIGLFAFAQEMVVGGWVGWFGRIAEYVGALFALVAFLGVRKTASARGVPVEEMLARFFGEAEAGYRSLVEASASAIIVVDPADRILVWNPAAERMFGYARTEAEGMPISLMGADPAFMSFIRVRETPESMAKGSLSGEDHIETIARRKDQSTFPVDMSVSGHWVGTSWARTCIIRDITQRKKSEEELRRKQAEVQVLFDNIPAGLVLFDATPPYTVLVHNRYYQELFAEPFHSQGMAGLNLYQYAPAVDAGGFTTVFDEVVRTGQPKSFLDFPYKSNPPNQTWFNWYMAPIIMDGRVVTLVSMSLDVTERHNIDEELRESRSKYQALAETTSDFVWETDAKGTFTYCNPQMERLWGRKHEEMIGKTFFDLMPPDERERMMETFGNVTGSSKPFSGVQSRAYDGYGKSIYIETNGVPFFDENGVLLGYRGISRDITGRKRTEEALKASEEEYRHLVEYAPTVIYELDYVVPCLKRVNDAMCNVLGYTREELLAANPFDLLADESRESFRERIRKILGGEHVDEAVEYKVLKKNGEALWLVLNVKLIGEAGKSSSALVVAHDHTAQKIAEQVLFWGKQREELLANAGTRLLSSENPQEIINDLCQGVMAFLECDAFFNYLVDHDQGRLRLNAYGGIPEEKAREIQWLDYGTGVWGCAALDASRIVAENIATTPDPRTDLVRPFGILAYACHPIQIGDEVIGTISFGTRSRKSFTDEELAFMKSMTDLIAIALQRLQTDNALRQSRRSLAQSEQALREASEYLENLIAYANAPIIVWDPWMKITRFNRAFEELTGMKEFEVLGETLEFLFPEAYREESMKLISRAMVGERMEVVELPILHRNGSVRTVLWNSATLFDQETGQMTATIAQGQDITERKQAEEALKEYAANLRRSNEDLERFAYVASHDLREPLRMVTSFSQMLEQRYKGRLDADADEFIGYIVDGGKKMNALINDLLEFSRITSRGKPFVPTDMNAVLNGVLKSLSIMIQENNAKIEAGALPVVTVDGLQMALVFQNLLTNAIKFHDNHAPVVSITAVREGNEWVFSVRDNGIGIDPEYCEKIFEIFQRLQSRNQYPGTGIGLAICKRVIDRHNGRIWVESDIGKGSTFYFTIPAD
jgi:PAS domain S-box-containing protein